MRLWGFKKAEVRQVANHAVLRYQERVSAVTMEEARIAIVEAMGRNCKSFNLPEGNRAIVKGGCVVTILPLAEAEASS